MLETGKPRVFRAVGATGLRPAPWLRWRELLFSLLPYLLILLSLLLFAVETVSMGEFVSGDFDIFRMAAQRALDDPARLYDQEGGALNAARELMGYIYPPPSIALFAPLAPMERMTAYAVAGAAGLLAAVAALWLWLRLMERAGIAASRRAVSFCALAMALVTGAVYTCRMGRIDTIILLVMVGAVALGEARRPAARFAGGALLALGGWIKIYPGLLVLPRLLDPKGRYVFFAGFAAGAVLVPTLCALVLPWPVWRDFFLVMLPEMSRRTIVNIDNQSLSAIAGRLIAARQIAVDNSFTAIELPLAIRWGVLVAGLTALLLTQRIVREAGQPRIVTAAIVMALTSLIAPLGWGHSYAYVLPLFVMTLVQALERQSLAWTMAIGAGWAAQVIPAHNIIPALERFDPLFHLYYARNALGTMIFIWAQFHFIARPRPARHHLRADAFPKLGDIH